MGDKEPVEEDDEVVSYAEPSRGVYKKLIVRNNRLMGAIVIGDGAIVPVSSRRFGNRRHWRTAGPSSSSLLSRAIRDRRRRIASPTPRRFAIATRSRRPRSSKRCWAAPARCRRSAT
jgi:hypothetical protein